MLKDYLRLPPHVQFAKGLVVALMAVFVIPLAGVASFLLTAGISLGTFGSSYSKFIVISQIIACILVVALGLLLPTYRLVITGRRFGRTYGRGDEHSIFTVAIFMLAVTALIVYPPYIRTMKEGGENQAIVMVFFVGLTIGLMLLILSLKRLSAISARVYPTTSASSTPRGKLKS